MWNTVSLLTAKGDSFAHSKYWALFDSTAAAEVQLTLIWRFKTRQIRHQFRMEIRRSPLVPDFLGLLTEPVHMKQRKLS